MSADTKFHVHHDSPEKIGRRERLGVRLLIVADGAFVFGMIFSYFYLRNLNVNNGWIPEGGHTFSASSGWVVVIPFIFAALMHRLAVRSGASFKNLSLLTLIVLVVGIVLQWKQISTMPFQVEGEEGMVFGYEGSYSSSWVLIAGANTFHYIITIFLALGLFIRARRAEVDPVLEKWRMATATSWFTWVAISGIACAITTSFI
ncbi:unannotated protein [freshwater metagenome]|uniref:Unannotated protein n=1 Tax=freshwater metagenome TaxID=449393 RepID=A0A6J6RVK2_9ZZZZ|nr:hypothetical protein [Actinomycetota bacterium]